jgi:hypothetical protein
MNPSSYLIIGCGRFGNRAAENLFQKDSHSKIIVVDKSKEAFQKVSLPPIETIVCDGVAYLNQYLLEGKKADYIIPAVPLHLAFEFILSQLKPVGAKKRRVPSLTGLPNPMRNKTGELYTSLATFLCPEDCSEPAQYCTVTRERRKNPLFRILEDLQGSFESRVIRSQQLGLGVGGYRPEVLSKVLEGIKKRRDSGHLFLVSTACRCHGVTSALSF